VLYAMCKDVTAETEKEKQKSETERLLIQQAKTAAMGDMLGAIAHQWKQPLNAVSLMMQYLSELSQGGGLTTEAVESVVNDATAQLQYMSRTIDDFRDYLKPETEEREFRVRSSILECVEIVHDQMPDIVIETFGGDFEIVGYPNRFKQAILNLLNNARDAINQRRIARPDVRGRIVIDVNDTLRKIDISDNGGGVPDDIAGRIFEPYFTTRPIEAGTGLGLYIVKMIAESMRGGIRHHNRREGACFTLQF
jgi:signal transduction histidine kinase